MSTKIIEIISDHTYKFNFLNNNDFFWDSTDLPVKKMSLHNLVTSNQKYADLLCQNLNSYRLVEEHSLIPRWWCSNNNKLYAPAANAQAELKIPVISHHPGVPEPKNSICFVNGESNFNLMLWGEGNFLYMSEKSTLPSSNIAIGSGCVIIGPNVRSAGQTNINVRNFGSVILEEDILLSNNCKLMTDDCHAIISTESGHRINPYGGCILIREHVWIGVQATVMGNSIVCEHNVIGERAFVRNINSSKNSILAGVPAKTIKTGVTWDPNDIEPSM